jgi:hypothetical protein
MWIVTYTLKNITKIEMFTLQTKNNLDKTIYQTLSLWQNF